MLSGKREIVRGDAMRKWLLFALGAVLILAGALLAHAIQTAGGVKVADVRFAGDKGETLSGLLYVPPSATAQTPRPAVLVSHGRHRAGAARLRRAGDGHDGPRLFRRLGRL